jgi:hypothetical protein
MEITQKTAKIFSCDICDFTSFNKHDFTRHLSTRKHRSNSLAIEITPNTQKTAPQHKCSICNKTYADSSGLWRHKKKCSLLTQIKEEYVNTPPTITMDIIMELLKQKNNVLKDVTVGEGKT